MFVRVIQLHEIPKQSNSDRRIKIESIFFQLKKTCKIKHRPKGSLWTLLKVSNNKSSLKTVKWSW